MGRLVSRGATPHEYHFESLWTIDAPPERLAEIISDPLSGLQWWPSAFLKGEIIDMGNDRGIGRTVRFLTKGFMPHTFQFVLRISEVDDPRMLLAEVAGDFNGSMRTTRITASAGQTRIRFDWVIRVHQPFVRAFSSLLRPIFSWNHRWVMTRGERGLQIHASPESAGGTLSIPGPTFPHCFPSYVDRIPWKPWTSSWEAAKARTA